MVTTRSSSKKMANLSRTVQEANGGVEKSEGSPLFSESQSATKTPGNKLTRELAGLGITTNRKSSKTPIRNLSSEMLAAMSDGNESKCEEYSHAEEGSEFSASVSSAALRGEDKTADITNSLQNTHISSKTSSMQDSSGAKESFSSSSQLKKYSSIFAKRYERPTASFLAKGRDKFTKVEDNVSNSKDNREKQKTGFPKVTKPIEAPYMRPTISNTAKRVQKVSQKTSSD